MQIIYTLHETTIRGRQPHAREVELPVLVLLGQRKERRVEPDARVDVVEARDDDAEGPVEVRALLLPERGVGACQSIIGGGGSEGRGERGATVPGSSRGAPAPSRPARAP